ncbi:DUF916 domain-containing protein [Microbacterium hominis]|uniref:WxL protein peptidoglycan domain-containing protein n=1 Tax=Microbacterium hominis TaxID=162426 RepID=UPI001963D86F|nr:DUF916 domain-containing protein [Microbacterium hominis]QRY41859.1 DUF916 domain-containing protein [Microbacterium hominis]
MFRSRRSRRSLPTALAAPLLAAAVLLGGVAVPAASAHAVTDAAAADSADDVTWRVRTASNGFGAERTSYTYAVDPGQSISDALVVSNHGSAPLQLAVYAADGYTGAGGQLDLLTPAETSVGIGAWTRAATTTVTVAPDESATVPFEVSVPATATPGDYVGGIVTSLASSADQGISVDRRLGIRIGLRVSGALAPALTIENPQVSWGGTWGLGSGAATLTYTLHNTGNTTMGAQQAASIAGPFGWFPTDAGDVAPEVQVLPGETRDVQITVPGIAGMLALVASATVTPIVVDASGSTSALEPVATQTMGLAVPWLLLILVLLAAAIALGAVWLRRRTAATRRRREDERVARAVADALAEAQGTVGAEDAADTVAHGPSAAGTRASGAD